MTGKPYTALQVQTSVFLHNLKEFFGYTKQTQLTQTFRSNQGIANVASGFIQKNESQLQKVVNAVDKTSSKVVEINFLTKTQEIHEYLLKTIMEINNANSGSGKKNPFIFWAATNTTNQI
jgi:DNA helicase-4